MCHFSPFQSSGPARNIARPAILQPWHLCAGTDDPFLYERIFVTAADLLHTLLLLARLRPPPHLPPLRGVLTHSWGESITKPSNSIPYFRSD